MNSRIENIIEKLDELEQIYQENKGIILTEYDLQCLVFHKIYDLFNHNQKTFDYHITGSPLHSEINFFDENGKLFYRPDITIIEPENYSIIHSISDISIKNERLIYKPTPSKEFEFGGNSIIIELKFCKNKNGIKIISEYEADLDKIKKIKRLVERDRNSKVYGLVVIFNKTDKKNRRFQEFINRDEDDIKIKYYTGKFEA